MPEDRIAIKYRYSAFIPYPSELDGLLRKLGIAYGNFTVNVSNPGHQGVRGVSDFPTEDELYMGIDYREENEVFITGKSEDGTYPWGPDRAPTKMPAGTFPLGWTRKYGDGKVFTLLLGHDGRSFQTPEFQKIVLNGVDWATAA